MIALPILAAVVGLVFGVHLLVRSGRRGNWFEAAWGVSMLLFAAATGALVLGVADGWSSFEFRAYWLLGAVLTVPYLALGEIYLLVRRPWVGHVVLVGVLVATAVAGAIVRTADVSAALQQEFPLGREVFGDGTAAHRLSQLYAYPAYALLLAGTLWSALRLRGRPEARNRFVGVLLIAVGATVVFIGSGVGAGFGNFAVFSIGHVVGITVMYWGFLVATRPPRATA
jgi:hypothetical protein